MPWGITASDQDETYDKIKQAVLVLDDNATHGKPIQEVPRSLMPVLSKGQLHGVRVYALSVDMSDERMDELQAKVRAELSDFT